MATTIEEYLKSYVETNKEQILRENRKRASIKAEEEAERKRQQAIQDEKIKADRERREAEKEEMKLNKRIELSDYLKRKEGSDCYECKTKVDKDGYCYC